MKTTIYELLGMIKDGKPPKKIKYADEVLEYDGYTIDYVDSDGDGLFNEYAWITELNDEVEILETTITYKPDKIEKIDLQKGIKTELYELASKINEIIDRINNE